MADTNDYGFYRYEGDDVTIVGNQFARPADTLYLATADVTDKKGNPMSGWVGVTADGATAQPAVAAPDPVAVDTTGVTPESVPAATSTPVAVPGAPEPVAVPVPPVPPIAPVPAVVQG